MSARNSENSQSKNSENKSPEGKDSEKCAVGTTLRRLRSKLDYATLHPDLVAVELTLADGVGETILEGSTRSVINLALEPNYPLFNTKQIQRIYNDLGWDKALWLVNFGTAQSKHDGREDRVFWIRDTPHALRIGQYSGTEVMHDCMTARPIPGVDIGLRDQHQQARIMAVKNFLNWAVTIMPSRQEEIGKFVESLPRDARVVLMESPPYNDNGPWRWQTPSNTAVDKMLAWHAHETEPEASGTMVVYGHGINVILGADKPIRWAIPVTIGVAPEAAGKSTPSHKAFLKKEKRLKAKKEKE